MPMVGTFRNALKTILTRIGAGFEELAAVSLLEEAVETLNEASAPHWHDKSIAAVPDMIRELARDRDDYRAMAESYRERLRQLEAELARLEQLPCKWRHEPVAER